MRRERRRGKKNLCCKARLNFKVLTALPESGFSSEMRFAPQEFPEPHEIEGKPATGAILDRISGRMAQALSGDAIAQAMHERIGAVLAMPSVSVQRPGQGDQAAGACAASAAMAAVAPLAQPDKNCQIFILTAHVFPPRRYQNYKPIASTPDMLYTLGWK